MNQEKKHMWDTWVKAYLKEWFTGLFAGLKQIDTTTRQDLLVHTGQSCANCGANKQYQVVWESSDSIPTFVEQLDETFKGPKFTLKDENTIEVVYPRCFCPLVELGLIKAPELCDCSVAWLQHNFESVLSKPVSVSKQESVLAGSDQCRFLVILSTRS